MTNLTQVFEQALALDGVLGEKARRLIALARDLAATLPALAGEIGDAEDPMATYEAIRDGLADPAIAAAFAALGADQLLADIRQVAADFDDALPDEVGILLRDLGTFEEAPAAAPTRPGWVTGDDRGLIAWDKDGRILSAESGQGSVSLSGRIAAACEAGSLWPYAGDQVPAKGLLRIGLAGELGVAANGSLPFAPGGSVGASAEAGAAAEIHLFWRPAPDRSVAAAIAEVAAHPVNIFALDDVLAACRGPRAFEGVVIAVDGHASLDIDLAIARDIDVEGFFSASAGLTVSIGLARKAAYELSVRKVADGVRLVLSHADADSRRWGVGVGITIDAAQIVRRVGAVMQDALEHWDGVLDEIKPFLSPGTWLQQQAGAELEGLMGRLAERIGNPAITDALRSDLALALGVSEQDESAVAQLLADRALGALGGLEGAISGKVDTLAKQAVAALAMRLPGVARDAVKTALEAEIADLIARYQSVMSDTVTALADTRAQAVAKALGKLGTKVSGAADALDARVAGLRRLIERADALVRRVAEKVEKAAEAKISARLRFERLRIAKEQFDIAGTFTDPTPEACALYGALMMGRLGRAAALFEPDSAPIPGFVPEPAQCSIRRFSSVSRTLGYEVVLLGLDLSGGSETTGSADIEVDGEQTITVNIRAVALREAQGIQNTSRNSEYVQAGSLLLAKAEDGARPENMQMAFAINLMAQRTDKRLTVPELRAFLAPLVACGLLAPARAEAAGDHLARAIATGGGTALQGAVMVEMQLSAAEVAALAAFGTNIPAEADLARTPGARTIFDTALDALFTTGEWKRADFEWFVRNFVKRANEYDRTAADLFREKYFANLDHAAGSATGSGPRSVGAPDQNRFITSRMRHEAVVALIALVGKTAAMQNAQPSRRFARSGAAWGLEDYTKASGAIARSAGKWIGLNQWLIVFFGSGVDQRTAALMLALARLAKGEGADMNPLLHVALVMDGVEAQGF